MPPGVLRALGAVSPALSSKFCASGATSDAVLNSASDAVSLARRIAAKGHEPISETDAK
jgi:hypothetical protein